MQQRQQQTKCNNNKDENNNTKKCNNGDNNNNINKMSQQRTPTCESVSHFLFRYMQRDCSPHSLFLSLCLIFPFCFFFVVAVVCFYILSISKSTWMWNHSCSFSNKHSRGIQYLFTYIPFKIFVFICKFFCENSNLPCTVPEFYYLFDILFYLS